MDYIIIVVYGLTLLELRKLLRQPCYKEKTQNSDHSGIGCGILPQELNDFGLS